MNRRQILQYTAWITGSAVSAPLAGAILSGCSEAPAPTTDTPDSDLPLLHYFAPEPFQRLTQLVDVILPRTDTPSATDVNVHTTIDSMLGRVMDSSYQAQFREMWLALLAHLDRHDFAGLDSEQQAALLSDLELNEDVSLATARQGLVELKQQTIAYYLTTEAVAEKHLNYLPIPGKYDPCITVESVNNKAWAI